MISEMIKCVCSKMLWSYEDKEIVISNLLKYQLLLKYQFVVFFGGGGKFEMFLREIY